MSDLAPIGTATEANGWSIYGPAVRGRKCGTCRSCCTIVPAELPYGHKPANVRCKHLKSRGCGIYDHRPQCCVYWSCRWLMDETTAGLRRPDQSGYIIDAMPDTILADDRGVPVVQIWVDPDHRDAHHDPALRAWLVEVYRRYRYVAIIRWGSSKGILLVPPEASNTGDWLELGEQTTLLSRDDMQAKLDAAGVQRMW